MVKNLDRSIAGAALGNQVGDAFSFPTFALFKSIKVVASLRSTVMIGCWVDFPFS